MIDIKDKTKCCGCSACMSVCPKSCISMECDDEGFLYPQTDLSLCIGCNACNRVCPMPEAPLTGVPFDGSVSYAASSVDNDILTGSSSGGIFSLLASEIIEGGGVVFGAAWDGYTIRHIRVSSIGELSLLRGSKYTQSDVGSTFREVKALLDSGTPVLYSGTPCEIGGLKSFIKKGTDLLTTVEVACHGAPSPKVLSAYLKKLKSDMSVEDIRLDFRSKVVGWNDYHIDAYDGKSLLFSENHKKNIYMRGFLHELYSRPSCHNCPFKGNYSGADITLADFWGIESAIPEFPSESGVSLVIVNNDKGVALWRSIRNLVRCQSIDLSVALRHNGSLSGSEAPHPERGYFFKRLSGCKDIVELIERCLRMRRITRLRLTLASLLKRFSLWH